MKRWTLVLLYPLVCLQTACAGETRVEPEAPAAPLPAAPASAAAPTASTHVDAMTAPASAASPQPTAAVDAAPAVPNGAPASNTPAANGAPAPTEDPPVMRPPGWQALSHERGAVPDYPRLFGEDRVQRIDIEMSAESKQKMKADLDMLLGTVEENQGFPFPGGPGGGRMPPADPSDLVGGDPIYVPVTVRYDGGVWTQVGMRFKGNSSLSTARRMGVEKLGFRLDFDRYEMEFPETVDQRFYGFSKMTFSGGFDDPSLIRDKLASEVLASLGLVAARCAFYRIFVDAGTGPVYWGLYTMIEDPADQLIEAQFEDKSGNMYKPDGEGAEWKSFVMEAFEKKSNEKAADYSDVMGAIAALHAPRDDAAAWRAGLEAKLNVKSFLDVLAFSRAIGHWDSYGAMKHNYYLYGDPLDMGRFVWISWDHNMSLAAGFPFARITVMMDEVTEDWPLIRFLLDDTVYRAQYLASLRAALGGLYEKVKFDARAKQLHELITPAVLGGADIEPEKAPYTFIMDAEQFRTALSEPEYGVLASADALRSDVATALGQ